ncbi:MAG: NHL repeat-containing protein [Verrucomicrobia bacterium]|nr:NHL repeat-containing protein [Verrucomicrobiota bacterium]
MSLPENTSPNAIPLISRSIIGLAVFFAAIASVHAQNVLYASVTNNTSGEIDTIDASGNAKPFVTGLSFPQSIALNSGGDLFVADNGTEQIDQVSPTGNLSVFASGLLAGGLAIDSAGNVYVANDNNGQIDRFNSQGVEDSTPFATGLSSPAGLTFDSSGNLFAADSGSGTIDKITPAGQLSTFASGLNSPTELKFDTSGDLFVSNFSQGTVQKFASGSTTPSTFVSGLVSPAGLAFDKSGNLFVADFLASTIDEVSPDGTVKSPPFLSPINAYDLAYGAAPVPEPNIFASLWVGLVSLGGFGFLRRRVVRS